MRESDEATRIAKELAGSNKYGVIHWWTVERVVRDCVARYGAKDAGRNARRILHQAWGAFFDARPNFDSLAFSVERELSSGGDPEPVLMPILALQSSTRERINHLRSFYAEVLEAAEYPKSVTDHACGLNPIAAILGMMPGVECYRGFDIDAGMIRFLESTARAAGRSESVRLSVRDAFEEDTEETDCALMLKLLPCLDLQKKGGAIEAMRGRRSRRIVVSFPVSSISGRKRGMGRFYEERFEETLGNLGWSYTKLCYSFELVFVVCKKMK